MSGKKKKVFRVEDYGSITACLDQMAKEHYQPVRRVEKPIFREEKDGPVVVAQEIIFEGKLEDL